jgi:nicotinamide mononucleotide adenylyltransferase
VSEWAPGELRAGWLAELHPHVTVVEVAHDLDNDFADESLWAKWMELLRGRWPHDEGPHVVFSSDAYVGELARRFEAEAVVVDSDRATVPISATMIRAAPTEHLDHLAPNVRA